MEYDKEMIQHNSQKWHGYDGSIKVLANGNGLVNVINNQLVGGVIYRGHWTICGDIPNSVVPIGLSIAALNAGKRPPAYVEPKQEDEELMVAVNKLITNDIKFNAVNWNDIKKRISDNCSEFVGYFSLRENSQVQCNVYSNRAIVFKRESR